LIGELFSGWEHVDIMTGGRRQPTPRQKFL
jgi:hypothetical protein